MKRFFVCSIILIFLFTVSCNKKDDGPNEPTEPTNIETVEKSGQLQVNPQAAINITNLNVMSFFEMKALGNDGSFTINAIKSNNFQTLLITDKLSGNPVYLGLYDPITDKLSVNDTSTALALALMNPYMIFADRQLKNSYLQYAQQSSKFDLLVSALNDAYKSDATKALDYKTNPNIYQNAVQLMKETLADLGGKNGFDQKSLGLPPSIEDVSGAEVKFVNNRYVYYAAGIYPNGGSLQATVTVERSSSLLSMQFGWPPVVAFQPAETLYSLGDGTFDIYMAKGFDFSKISQWDDPMGRATMMNTGQSILYLVDLVIGFMPDLDLATLPNNVTIRSQDVLALGNAVKEGDAGQFLIDFCDMMIYNKEGIAYWIYQQTASNAAHSFINSAAGMLKNVATVIKILGFANEQAPFFSDLVFAPKDVRYTITQQGGVITVNSQNDPPNAEFTIYPPAGVVGTSFSFDASASTDDSTPSSNLQFRWDFQSDGSWDTQWSNTNRTSFSYSSAGSYVVILEVMDANGLIGVQTHSVNVGGGAGTANHVKLFMDGNPWNSTAMIDMLQSLGFSEGVGANTYEIIPSSQMATVELYPGTDLVIVSNDQNQNFYNTYAANQVKFTNFVYSGGSLFWEACDEGWAGGSITDANIILPGNVEIVYNYDNYNYVTDQNLPLVAGLPNQMDHNYASHEGFANIPDGTTVYCKDSNDNPTLIEYNLEGGWVIMSGQPLEHQYDHVYGNNDMEELLPRIVAYFTGKNLPKKLPGQGIKKSTRNTHE